jgi:hypothetical protein
MGFATSPATVRYIVNDVDQALDFIAARGASASWAPRRVVPQRHHERIGR